MKYETLSESKSGSYVLNDTVTFTFTFTNNISDIRCLHFQVAGNTNYWVVSSISTSDNILTVTVTNKYNDTYTYYLFLLATVSSY